jgi:hypothetical protein
MMLIGSTPSYADNLEPETALLPTSAKQAFVMDAALPNEYWGALDERRYLAITGLSIGEKMIAAGGQSLMNLPDHVCSIYDSSVCFDVGSFYHAPTPQILMSGFFMLDGDDALVWGFDSGFRSEKLTVSPALLLGLSKRWYLSERRDSQFIFEASGWFGQSVSHTPCYDQFDRPYYCANLSAWSDFTYNQHPSDLYLKLWYEKLF